MQSLHDFFRALDHFLGNAVGYMSDGLFGSYDYREGFAAGIVFLVLIVGFGLLVPYAARRILVFFGPRPPSLAAGAPPASLFGGCLWGSFILFVLTFLVLGMIWGLT